MQLPTIAYPTAYPFQGIPARPTDDTKAPWPSVPELYVPPEMENQNKHTQKKFCFEMMSIFLDKHPDWATFFGIFQKGIPLIQSIQSTKTYRNSSHLKKKTRGGTRQDGYHSWGDKV